MCHSVVTLEARSPGFTADSREKTSFVISYDSLQNFLFFPPLALFFSFYSYRPAHSLPTLHSIAPCIPLHSGLPMVLRLIQMFPSVFGPKQLCRETLSFRSPTSPLISTFTGTSGAVSALSHTQHHLIPDFPPCPPEPTVLIISTGLLVLIS